MGKSPFMLYVIVSAVLSFALAGCSGSGGGASEGQQLALDDGGTQTLQLAWDAPTDENGTPQDSIIGYYLYYGPESGTYDVSIDVGLQETVVLSNLLAEQPYYFAVTAYDDLGNESDYSNEVCAILLPEVVELCD